LISLKGTDHLQVLSIGGRIIIKWTYKQDVKMLTGLNWLGIETSGELFLIH
jgi:hypothetical protein